MKRRTLDIIIPTWNNPDYLRNCVMSLLRTGAPGSFAHIIIVNNGQQTVAEEYKDDRITVITPGKNLGWEGGLKEGLKESSSEFVTFLNDDTFIPQANSLFFNRTLTHFIDDKVSAVGPVTTVAAGLQNIFHPQSPQNIVQASWLIYFCVTVRRKHLDEVGGVDDTLPGGDDFDLSIRFNKAGYKSIIDPALFLIHHAFVTGNRVRGDSKTPMGWNSPEMTESVNMALIKKHGFKCWLETVRNQIINEHVIFEQEHIDREGDMIRSMINGESAILELGCGSKKTIPKSVGLDIVEGGKPLDQGHGGTSVADICADATKRLPFDSESQDAVVARHILEHCVDSVSVIKEWKRVLKKGGKLIVACPNEQVTNGIPLNPEHVHAFDPASMTSLMKAVGLKACNVQNSGNGTSFVGVYKK